MFCAHSSAKEPLCQIKRHKHSSSSAQSAIVTVLKQEQKHSSASAHSTQLIAQASLIVLRSRERKRITVSKQEHKHSSSSAHSPQSIATKRNNAKAQLSRAPEGRKCKEKRSRTGPKMPGESRSGKEIEEQRIRGEASGAIGQKAKRNDCQESCRKQ